MKFNEAIEQILNETISKYDVQLNKVIQKILPLPEVEVIKYDKFPEAFGTRKVQDVYNAHGSLNDKEFEMWYISPKENGNFLILSIGDKILDSAKLYLDDEEISDDMQKDNLKDAKQILKSTYKFKV